MRCSKDKKLLFLSNPKCGSTSVRHWLDKLLLCERETYGEDDLIGYGGNHHSRNLHETSRYWQERYEVTDDWFVFATIRNPWAKMVSHYYYDKLDRNLVARYLPDYNGKPEVSFKSFIKKWYQIEDKYMRQRRLPIDEFASPSVRLFKIEDTNQIKIEIANWLKTDPTSLPKIDCLQPDGMVGTSKHKHYSCYYDESTKLAVSKIYAADIVAGNYKFNDMTEIMML